MVQAEDADADDKSSKPKSKKKSSSAGGSEKKPRFETQCLRVKCGYTLTLSPFQAYDGMHFVFYEEHDAFISRDFRELFTHLRCKIYAFNSLSDGHISLLCN